MFITLSASEGGFILRTLKDIENSWLLFIFQRMNKLSQFFIKAVYFSNVMVIDGETKYYDLMSILCILRNHPERCFVL